MRIKPNQTFLHERDKFEKDVEVDVQEHLGYYFCAVGWADPVNDEEIISKPQVSEVTLDIHNSTLKNEAESPGHG